MTCVSALLVFVARALATVGGSWGDSSHLVARVWAGLNIDNWLDI